MPLEIVAHTNDAPCFSKSNVINLATLISIYATVHREAERPLPVSETSVLYVGAAGSGVKVFGKIRLKAVD